LIQHGYPASILGLTARIDLKNFHIGGAQIPKESMIELADAAGLGRSRRDHGNPGLVTTGTGQKRIQNTAGLHLILGAPNCH